MSESPQTADFALTAYNEAVESYEQLQTVFQLPHHPINNSVKLSHLETCFQKIQALIHIELGLNISPEGQFCSEICTSLFLLREQLIQLTNTVQKSTLIEASSSRIIVPTKLPQPVPHTKTIVQNSNANVDQQEQLKQIIRSTQVTPKVKGLRDIAGLSDVKKMLTTTIILPIYQPQLYAGQKICNSILLYGPPGTGKTRLVHALAAEGSACLFSVTSSDILSQYVGQTEKMARALFQTVKEARDCCTILFMDEIDGLCKCRNDGENEWSRRLKTELMCQLSNFEDCPSVFLMCATNCPWDLDPAFLRRFQQRIYVPLPNRPERFEILQLLTKDTPLEATTINWGPLLNKTEGYSGSDLADLVRHAMHVPLTELTSTTMWEQVGNNIYKPAMHSQSFHNIICCELSQMPPGSVQARPVQVFDLMVAADVVKRTVSAADVQKYEAFVNKV